LRPAQEKLVGIVFANLVRDPCLGRARGKGVAQTPDHLGEQDGQECWEESLHEETYSH
jgi:hypothetical protein